MQAMNILQHKFTLINQTNEPQKEHVKISDTAKFRAVGQTHTTWQALAKPK